MQICTQPPNWSLTPCCPSFLLVKFCCLKCQCDCLTLCLKGLNLNSLICHPRASRIRPLHVSLQSFSCIFNFSLCPQYTISPSLALTVPLERSFLPVYLEILRTVPSCVISRELHLSLCEFPSPSFCLYHRLHFLGLNFLCLNVNKI